ncbi:uncharacterized protein LOC120670954 isoform X1 [Panicum virgatum]|uniref:Cyanobacterial aminoacyl-tRNA synthetase CAAD domain-containing protein n=1 Tax=Panicum virgatum TaxID=38727 RepID=A0A8T0T8I6_PANVG|nr:uncharacterized protein LOC120670954 isoform X1 [Panicum virgatum]KAG2605494.1 hypothetical protein PVAP13_4NG132100 [Panicum virgatum]
MASPACTTNAAAGTRAGHGLPVPRRGPSPSSAPVALRRCSLPTRGLSLRCAGTDWSDPAFVTVAEKLDAAAAARKARALAGAGGEEEKGRVEAFNGVISGAVEEQPVAVPFEQSLVAVDSVVGNNDALSRALGSKLGLEEISTYVIYGTGAFFAGWILSAVVSALDSIPLLPKILEIVGLGYTIWFGTRYLLFKENRDELLVKVEDLKSRIVGSSDE